jgi:hypothetical protein
MKGEFAANVALRQTATAQRTRTKNDAYCENARRVLADLEARKRLRRQVVIGLALTNAALLAYDALLLLGAVK